MSAFLLLFCSSRRSRITRTAVVEKILLFWLTAQNRHTHTPRENFKATGRIVLPFCHSARIVIVVVFAVLLKTEPRVSGSETQ